MLRNALTDVFPAPAGVILEAGTQQQKTIVFPAPAGVIPGETLLDWWRRQFSPHLRG